MDKYTNERVIKKLRIYLNKINKKFKIEKAILFGSRARDDWLLNSDVDLILISKDFENLKFRERMAQVIGEWDEYVDLEVICYTQKEFDVLKKRIGLVKEAAKEGVEIK